MITREHHIGVGQDQEDIIINQEVREIGMTEEAVNITEVESLDQEVDTDIIQENMKVKDITIERDLVVLVTREEKMTTKEKSEVHQEIVIIKNLDLLNPIKVKKVKV